MDFLVGYLLIGVGMYLGLSLKDPLGFVNANAASLIRGLLLGIFFWPIGMVIQIIWIIEDKSPTNGKRRYKQIK